MNSNGISKAVYFTAGLCIGGGAAYILVKKRYRLLAEEEIASVKEAFQRINEVKTRQTADDWSSQPDPEADNSKEEYVEVLYHAGYSTVSNEVPKDVVARQVVDVDIDAEEETVEVHVSQFERDPKKPYEIDVSDFMTSEFDTISLTYWVEDEMLVDERDSQVEDTDSTIGLHLLEQLKNMTEDGATIYIRNERLEVDFEVVRSPGSFGDTLVNPNDTNTHWDDKRPKLKRSDG